MLTKNGINMIRSELPAVDEKTVHEIAGSKHIGDRETQDFFSRYRSRFTAGEAEQALIGLSNGVTFDQLDYCASVCDEKKRESKDESELMHGFDETVRLYCIAFESDETIYNHRHLDDMVEAMRLVQRFAGLYREDDEDVCLIRNADELWSFPLTPDGYITSLIPFACDHNMPVIPTSYYINLKDMQITGRITPSALWSTKHSGDREPFLFRQYQSLNQIIDMLEDSLSIEPVYEDLFMARPEEQSKGFLQYCERSGKHFGNLLATPDGIKHMKDIQTVGEYGLAGTAGLKVCAVERGADTRVLAGVWNVDGYPAGGAEWYAVEHDKDGRAFIWYGFGPVFMDEIRWTRDISF